MKRRIYIQIIKDYILEKPGRSASEINEYAADINATNEELLQALSEANVVFDQAPTPPQSQLQMAKKKAGSFHFPSIQGFNFQLTPKLALQTVAVVSVSGFLVLALSSLYLFTKVNTISDQIATTQNPIVMADSKTGVAFLSSIAEPVYASQQIPVNGEEIFSYPPSDITLKYSGTVNREIFGFFPYWMIDQADKIDLRGYTDVALFGLTPDSKGNIITARNGQVDPGWEMWNSPKLDGFIKRLKKQNTRVELVLKSFNNEDMESIVNNNENQARFIANAVQLMNSKSLDGINIDFEYTGTPSEETRDNFTRFIANLNAEMKRQNPDSLLTIDTYISSGADSRLFNLSELAHNIDAFVVMGYDIHTPSGDAGPVAPLEGAGGIAGYIQSYLERVGPEKIILALPYYGYDWSVKSGAAGSKILPYAVIAGNNKTSAIMWDKTSQTPYYRYRDPESGVDRVVHFDNSRSLGLKYDFINNKNLRGAGIWALGYDGLNQELHQVLLDKFTK